MDIGCAHCNQPWDVDGLRHDGWDYLTDEQASQLGVTHEFTVASDGGTNARRVVSQAVYKAVLSGKGCPDTSCGFSHGDVDGPFREQQLMALVFDSVSDDDPAEFF